MSNYLGMTKKNVGYVVHLNFHDDLISSWYNNENSYLLLQKKFEFTKNK
jgi:hypothetical protein